MKGSRKKNHNPGWRGFWPGKNWTGWCAALFSVGQRLLQVSDVVRNVAKSDYLGTAVCCPRLAASTALWHPPAVGGCCYRPVAPHTGFSPQKCSLWNVLCGYCCPEQEADPKLFYELAGSFQVQPGTRQRISPAPRRCMKSKPLMFFLIWNQYPWKKVYKTQATMSHPPSPLARCAAGLQKLKPQSSLGFSVKWALRELWARQEEQL